MTEVYVQGRRIRLDPTQSVGKGGEADVFRIAPDTVLKVYKPADHPDYAGNKFEMDAAKARLMIHQDKLPAFPKTLPDRVVSPRELATDRTGKRIVGYTMAFIDAAEVLLRYAERSFRQGRIGNGVVKDVFLDLYRTVERVHAERVLIGDFNDLNVMVRQTEAHLIDADSFQFSNFLCTVFTERFVDPLLCDPKQTRPILVKPHTADSDWYAFAVMLFRSLVLCDPYGGVYKPKQPTNVLHAERPLRRITVFNKDVRYPKPAIPYEVLPDELLSYFHRVFEKDARGPFPVRLLEAFAWRTCTACGTEHGRPACPTCKRAAPEAVKQVVQVRGKVTSTRIFATNGQILYATVQGGELKWLYEDPRDLRREDGGLVLEEHAAVKVRYRISGSRSLMSYKDALTVFTPGQPETTIYPDPYGKMHVFDANERRIYWVQGGVLVREHAFAPQRIGDVLQNQTLFWVGSRFGFGFYRAADLSMAFVFDADRGGLNDTVKIPPLKGHLTDAVAYFTSDACWFLASLRDGGRAVNRCHLIRPNGTVEAVAEGEPGDGSWLGQIRGKCAGRNFLLSVTDDGIVRVQPQMSTLVKTAEFPDTEPFVDTSCHLHAGKEGVYVVDRNEIRVLKIS